MVIDQSKFVLSLIKWLCFRVRCVVRLTAHGCLFLLLPLFHSVCPRQTALTYCLLLLLEIRNGSSVLRFFRSSFSDVSVISVQATITQNSFDDVTIMTTTWRCDDWHWRQCCLMAWWPRHCGGTLHSIKKNQLHHVCIRYLFQSTTNNTQLPNQKKHFFLLLLIMMMVILVVIGLCFLKQVSWSYHGCWRKLWLFWCFASA